MLPREERKASLADLLTPAVDGIELSEQSATDCVSPCLQTRLRRHSVEAARLDISLWSWADVDQGKEPGQPGDDTGVGAVILRTPSPLTHIASIAQLALALA